MHQNLQSSGFQYVNLDDFWYLDPRVTVDAYGRWVPDPTTFPDGMAALAAYIHSLGLKFGMYITPGIPVAAVNANTPIEGTRYSAKDIADVSQYEINYNFGNSFTVLVSNPSGNTQTGTTSWSMFGIPGPVIVRDLWSGANLIGTPNQDGSYQIPGPLPFSLAAYQTQLLKVTPMVPVTQYLVDGPNAKLLGSAVYAHANFGGCEHDNDFFGVSGDGARPRFNHCCAVAGLEPRERSLWQ
jgi:hypothetical protein